MNHSLVNINNCETAYIGGYSSNSSAQSSAIHIYNWNTEEWRGGPDLNMPRDGHRCIKIKNPEGERWTVIIAGKITKIWNCQEDKKWPKTFDWVFQLTKTGKKLILSNGYRNC